MGIKHNITQKIYRSKKALSPAIAVALLLAITIALVAAVSYAVSNTSSTSTNVNTPKATFNVEINKGAGSVVIQQISGDSIRTSDLKLIFTANGTRTEITPYTGWVYDTAKQNVNYTYGSYQAPWLVKPGEMPDPYPYGTTPNYDIWFGSYTISPGSVMKAQGGYEGPTVTNGNKGDDAYAMIKNWNEIYPGDIVNLMIIYTPSNQVIWQGDVTVR